jgi:hypothetical protein
MPVAILVTHAPKSLRVDYSCLRRLLTLSAEMNLMKFLEPYKTQEVLRMRSFCRRVQPLWKTVL